MYAPLDFRLVIGPELYGHQFTTKQSRYGWSWIRPDQKTNPGSCVPIRGRGLLAGVAQKGPQKFHFSVFRPECKPKPSSDRNTQSGSARAAAVTKACSEHSRPLQLGEKRL
jgi:hypothetical protein